MRASVIVPVYNAERHLAECLDSVLGQTVSDIQVICVDDQSTDGSRGILQSYADKYPAVTVLTQENAGPGVARNRGLDVAKGDFVAFLDADDYWRPAYLERAISAMEAAEADMAMVRVEHFYEATGQRPQTTWDRFSSELRAGAAFNATDIPEEIFLAFGNEPWGKLFRRDFIEREGLRFPPLRRTEDLPMVCRAFILAKRLVLVDECLMTYRRVAEGSAMCTNDVAPLDFYEAFQTLEAFLRERGAYETFRYSFLNHALNGIMFNLESQRTYEGFTAVWQAVCAPDGGVFGILDADASVYRDRAAFDRYRYLVTHDEKESLFFLYDDKKRDCREAQSARTRAELEMEQARARLGAQQTEAERLAGELSDVRESTSFKVGHAVVAPLGKIFHRGGR